MRYALQTYRTKFGSMNACVLSMQHLVPEQEFALRKWTYSNLQISQDPAGSSWPQFHTLARGSSAHGGLTIAVLSEAISA